MMLNSNNKLAADDDKDNDNLQLRRKKYGSKMFRYFPFHYVINSHQLFKFFYKSAKFLPNENI